MATLEEVMKKEGVVIDFKSTTVFQRVQSGKRMLFSCRNRDCGNFEGRHGSSGIGMTRLHYLLNDSKVPVCPECSEEMFLSRSDAMKRVAVVTSNHEHFYLVRRMLGPANIEVDFIHVNSIGRFREIQVDMVIAYAPLFWSNDLIQLYHTNMWKSRGDAIPYQLDEIREPFALNFTKK